MQPTIRKAILEDAALLAHLNYSVHVIHVEQMPHRYKPTTPDSADVQADFENRLQSENNLIYIAEIEGEAVGYMNCQIRNVADNPYVLSQHFLEIDQMSVQATYRGQGIGSALLDYAVEVAREHDIDTLVLGVAGFNEGAQRLYARHGFRVDSVRMLKKLDEADYQINNR
jgi:ribosomal protein S18 acetylase RimI-like enzyme